jgi:thiamine kinase-like enzyme
VASDVVLERAKSVLPADQTAFLRHLEAMGERWDGLEIPLRCVHGDLAPTNCLIDGNRSGVIDWDGATARRSPLPDLLFFLYQYARVHPQRAFRPRGESTFRLAFLADGWLADLSARSYRQQLRRLGLPVEAGEYLFAATVVDLATGRTPTAHAAAAVRQWKAALHEYAAHHPDLRIAKAGIDPRRG